MIGTRMILFSVLFPSLSLYSADGSERLSNEDIRTVQFIFFASIKRGSENGLNSDYLRECGKHLCFFDGMESYNNSEKYDKNMYVSFLNQRFGEVQQSPSSSISNAYNVVVNNFNKKKNVQVINADLQKFQQISNFQNLCPDYTYDDLTQVYEEPLAVVAAYIYEEIECTLAHKDLSCVSERKDKQRILIEAFNAHQIIQRGSGIKGAEG